MYAPPTPEVDPRLNSIEELVVIYNPTNEAAVGHAQALHADSDSQLQDHGLRAVMVPSEPTLAANIELVRQEVPQCSGRALMVAGGDGLTSNILHAAMEVGVDHPVLFRPCGNANDLAKMTYGGHGLKWPLELLFHTGQIAELRPLAIS